MAKQDELFRTSYGKTSKNSQGILSSDHRKKQDLWKSESRQKIDSPAEKHRKTIIDMHNGCFPNPKWPGAVSIMIMDGAGRCRSESFSQQELGA